MKRRRLYYIGGGGSSWRDPRNWSRRPDGEPVRHLHADRRDVLVVGGKGPLDLRGMPNAGLELRRFEGKLRLPDGSALDFAPQSRWKLWRRRRLRPSVPATLLPAVASVGGWRKAVAKGLAQLALTDRGWILAPLLSGGAVAHVQHSAVATNNGTTGAAAPTNFGGASTTAGNYLVATVDAELAGNGGTFAVANGVTGWSLAVSDTTRNNVQSAIFVKPNCGAVEAVPTFTYSNSGTVHAALWEFSGAAALDQTGHANSAGSASLPAAPTAVCGSTDFASSGALVVTADAFSFGSNYVESSSDTYNNGATPTGNLNNDATNTRTHYRHAYGITTGRAAADQNSAASGQAGTADIASTCIISIRAATTFFWVSGTGTWDGSTTTHWAISSGGGGSAGVPTASDTVNFDANSGTAATVTITGAARATAVTLNKSDLTLTHNAANGTIQSSSSGIASWCGGTFTLTTGSWLTNGNTIIMGGVLSSNANTRTVNLGASSLTLAAGSWSFTTITNLTSTFSSSTIIFSTGTGARTFAGGGLTYGTVQYLAMASNLTINQSNTFTTLDIECAAAHTLTLANSATQTVTNLTLSGASGQNLTIHSADSVTATTLQVACNGTLTTAFYTLGSEVAIKVCATTVGGLPYSALLGVAATVVEPYEAKKSLAVTSSEPYEAKKSLAATAIEPYEAKKALAATASEPYEAGKGIAATSSDPYETKKALAVTGVLPYSAVQPVTATGALPYESLLGLARTGALPYTTNQGIVAAVAEAYETLARIVASAADPYETIAVLSKSGALPYSTLTSVLASVVLPYESRLEIAASIVLPYEELGGIAVAGALPYETIRSLVASEVLPYSVFAGVAAIASEPYETRVAVAASGAFPYSTLGRLVASGSLPYSAQQALAANAVLGYESRVAVTLAALLPFEALRAVSGQAQTPYEAVAALAAAAGLPYETLAAALGALADLPYETRIAVIRAAILPYEAIKIHPKPGFVIGEVVADAAGSSTVVAVATAESSVVQTAGGEIFDKPAGVPGA